VFVLVGCKEGVVAAESWEEVCTKDDWITLEENNERELWKVDGALEDDGRMGVKELADGELMKDSGIAVPWLREENMCAESIEGFGMAKELTEEGCIDEIYARNIELVEDWVLRW